jgi:hypothetical protein
LSAFGGLILTNKGRNLQAKAQAGAQLNFTRIGVGDGELAGSSILDLNALKHEVKSLVITKFKSLGSGKAVVGGVLSNQDLASGFYWRELGVFAQDPDLGEILYCYGNSGANAEYIPAGGGADIVEKSIDVITLVGNASSISATIDTSLTYVSTQEFNTHTGDAVAHVTQADRDAWDGKVDQTTFAAHLAENATETIKGHVELATAAETTTGTDNTRAVHPAGLKVELDKKANLTDLSAQTANKGASMIGVQDSGGHFTGTNVESVLAELFTSVSNGKTQLETAVTDKGGTVSKAGSVATFAELDTGVRSIPEGLDFTTAFPGTFALGDNVMIGFIKGEGFWYRSATAGHVKLYNYAGALIRDIYKPGVDFYGVTDTKLLGVYNSTDFVVYDHNGTLLQTYAGLAQSGTISLGASLNKYFLFYLSGSLRYVKTIDIIGGTASGQYTTPFNSTGYFVFQKNKTYIYLSALDLTTHLYIKEDLSMIALTGMQKHFLIQ